MTVSLGKIALEDQPGPGRYEAIAESISNGGYNLVAAAREDPPAIVVDFPDGYRVTLFPLRIGEAA